MARPPAKPGFAVAADKGFQITFANGWTVSVMFGWMNYCEHRDKPTHQHGDRMPELYHSRDAEVAVFGPDGRFAKLNMVKGWVTPDEVAAIIAATAAR